MNRPGWDLYFMNIARAVAQKASCPRAKCGTVIIDPSTHIILSTGYNGAPPGEDHCIDVGCLMEDNHCQRALHSEVNAVAHATIKGVSIYGAHAYVYGDRADREVKDVCRECSKVLRSANITVVVCAGESYFDEWLEAQPDSIKEVDAEHGIKPIV